MDNIYFIIYTIFIFTVILFINNKPILESMKVRTDVENYEFYKGKVSLHQSEVKKHKDKMNYHEGKMKSFKDPNKKKTTRKFND